MNWLQKELWKKVKSHAGRSTRYNVTLLFFALFLCRFCFGRFSFSIISFPFWKAKTNERKRNSYRESFGTGEATRRALNKVRGGLMEHEAVHG